MLNLNIQHLEHWPSSPAEAEAFLKELDVVRRFYLNVQDDEYVDIEHLELVLNSTANIETFLRAIYGVRSTHLHAQVDEIDESDVTFDENHDFWDEGDDVYDEIVREDSGNRLPPAIRDRIHFIATLRNRLLHEPDYNELDDPAEFNAAVQHVAEYLENHPKSPGSFYRKVLRSPEHLRTLVELLRYSKPIEHLLETKLGAEGRGLFSKANSLREVLPASVVHRITRLARDRNDYVHGRPHRFLRLDCLEDDEPLCDDSDPFARLESLTIEDLELAQRATMVAHLHDLERDLRTKTHTQLAQQAEQERRDAEEKLHEYNIKRKQEELKRAKEEAARRAAEAERERIAKKQEFAWNVGCTVVGLILLAIFVTEVVFAIRSGYSKLRDIGLIGASEEETRTLDYGLDYSAPPLAEEWPLYRSFSREALFETPPWEVKGSHWDIELTRVIMSHDGRRLAIQQRSGAWTVVDTERRELVPAFADMRTNYGYYPFAAFSSDGSTVSFATCEFPPQDDRLVVSSENPAIGHLVCDMTSAGELAISSDGTTVAIASVERRAVVRVINTQTGRQLCMCSVPHETGRTVYHRGVSLSNDGRLLAVKLTGGINGVAVFNTSTGKELARFSNPSGDDISPHCHLFRNGEILVLGYFGSDRSDCWRWRDGVLVGSVPLVFRDPVLLSDSGRFVLVGTRTWDGVTSVRSVNVHTGEVLRQVRIPYEIHNSAISGDGLTITCIDSQFNAHVYKDTSAGSYFCSPQPAHK